MTLMTGTELAPLPPADEIQRELAEVDAQFHLAFGREESGWLPAQVAAYNRAIDAVWAANRCPTCGFPFEQCRCTGGTR